MRKLWSIIGLLTNKSYKSLVRQKSVKILAIISSLIVCGSLYLMWLFSIGQTVSFMTSSAYSRLSFDLACQPNKHSRSNIICHPIDSTQDQSEMSSTDFLLSVLQDGGTITSNSQETKELAGLLSSIMMDGLPLLGLDDFVYLSDFVNTNIGVRSKKQLLKYPGYKEKFGSFLNIRQNQLRITPRSEWSDEFIAYLGNTSTTFSKLNVQVFDSMEDAMLECCDEVWAIVDITPAQTTHQHDSLFNMFAFNDTDSDDSASPLTKTPAVTIRMHPASIPDTRNFEWSPLQRSAPTRQQSGQLLYFISGFLSLQIEVQNFLAYLSLDSSTRIETNVFRKQSELLLQPSQVAGHIAQALFKATDKNDVYASVVNSTSRSDGDRPSLFFPLYHRAFPTHDYKQSMYWHVFGTLVTIALIMYFCLPPAMVAGAYRKELSAGLLDILSTYPGVRYAHSMLAWCLCCNYWVLGCFFVTLTFFYAVLEHSNSLIPSVCLLLFGCALGPFSMLLGEIVQNADAVVVAVPSIVFITLLPGLLYFDLAFDVQRSFYLEMAMSLLPSSAVALGLRLIFATESIFVQATWFSRAAVSHTPLYAYAVMLAVDCLLYGVVCLIVVWRSGRNALYKDKYVANEDEEGGLGEGRSGGRGSRSNSVEMPRSSSPDSSPSFQYSSLSASRQPSSPISNTQRRRRGAAGVCSSLRSAFSECLSSVYQAVLDMVQWLRGQHAYSVISPGAGRRGDGISPPKSVQEIVRRAFSIDVEDENDEESPQQSGHRESPSKVAVAIQFLTKQRTSGNIGVVVLSNISTVLKKDCITLLLGSNGAGKTTLMKILSGIDSQYSGDIRVSKIGAPQNSAVRNRRAIGWCPQNDALFPLLTVQEHLELFTELLNASDAGHNRHLSSRQRERAARTSVAEGLAKLGMAEHRDKQALALSGGMKRRLSLALAFIGNPAVLLLDEPTSGCDSYTRELVRKDILSHKDPGCAVLISTHHTDDIEVLADHIWFLNDRYLEFDDSVDRLEARHRSSSGNHAAVNIGQFNNNKGDNNDLKCSSLMSSRSDLSTAASVTDLNSCDAALPAQARSTSRSGGGTYFFGDSDTRNDISDFSAGLNTNLEFSTWSEEVRGILVERVGKELLDSWFDLVASTCEVETSPAKLQRADVADNTLSDEKDTANFVLSSNVYVWVVEPAHHAVLFRVIRHLEREGRLEWSLHTSYAYKALCHLYSDDKKVTGDDEAGGVVPSALFRAFSPPQRRFRGESPTEEQPSSFEKKSSNGSSGNKGSGNKGSGNKGSDDGGEAVPTSWLAVTAWQFYAILWMRFLELKASFSVFALTQLAIPFLVVLAVTCSCRDVNYPKVELTSSSVRGIGEIPVSQGRKDPFVGGGVKATILKSRRRLYEEEEEEEEKEELFVDLDLLKGSGAEEESAGGSAPGLYLQSHKKITFHKPTKRPSRQPTSQPSLQQPSLPPSKQRKKHNESESALFRSLVRSVGNGSGSSVPMDLSWQGYMNSDEMYTQLYDAYYTHSTQRWGSLILQDTVPQWVESTVVVEQSALSVDIVEAFAEILAAQRAICDPSPPTTAPTFLNSSSVGSHNITGNGTAAIANATLHRGATAGVYISRRVSSSSVPVNGTRNSAICGPFPSTTVSLRNTSSSSAGSSANYSIAISSFESMHSNLTMLTNVTTDHAAPVFLKEVIPAVYSAMARISSGAEPSAGKQKKKRNLVTSRDEGNTGSAAGSASSESRVAPRAGGVGYVLFSHPMPEVNFTNEVYIERGFLGSTIIMLYMLITTISVVRFVAKARGSGMKTQLHIAGVHPAVYWTANFIFDAALLTCTLLSVYLAIFLGGDPIRNYFFPFAPAPGVLFLLCIVSFACAITACGCAFTVLSQDPLTSQLFMLISAVVTGGFLKLYLDRHRDFPYTAVSEALMVVAPSFAFSTALYDMFKVYGIAVTKALTGVDHTAKSVKLLAETHRCILLMAAQTGVYLSMCILLDMHITKIVSFVRQWRWYYSALLTTAPGAASVSFSPAKDKEGDTLLFRSGSGDHVEMMDALHAYHTPLKDSGSGRSSGRFGTSTYPSYSSTASLDLTMESVDLASETKAVRQLKTPNVAYLPTPSGQGVMSILREKHVSAADNVGIFPLIDPDQYRQAVLVGKLNGVNSALGKASASDDLSMDNGCTHKSTSVNPKTCLLASNLCVEYPHRSKLALCDLSFSLPANSRVALMGMNGGGKSTLFKTMALAQNVPLAGHLSIFGRDVVSDSWAVGSDNLMGYVPQEGGLFEFLTVKETIDLFVMLKLHRHATASDFTPPSDGDAEGEDCSIVPSKYLGYPVYALSGGTKKKLLIRLTDIRPPGLLLLDECTTGVDPIAAERIMRHLRDRALQSRSDQALLFSSHRIDESLAVCDRVLLLVDGQTYLDGPIDSFSALAYQFYQIDVVLDSAYNIHSNAVLFSLAMSDSYIPLNISLVDYFVLHITNATTHNQQGQGHHSAGQQNSATKGTDWDRGGEGENSNRDSSSGQKRRIERVVAYSSTLVRVTFEKSLVPISSMYRHLNLLKEQGLVVKYSFRNMDMEEVLSTIIATTKNEQS